MTGKPTIPPRIHARIRKLAASGMSQKAMAEAVGHSTYTVRKAIDEDFVERERERHRRSGKQRYKARKNDADYVAYQAKYSASPKRLKVARETMRRIREGKR